MSETINNKEQILKELQQANLIMENSPVVIFRWKAVDGWPVEYVSKNIIQFGYSDKELLSGEISFSSIIHPDDLERVGREVAEYSSKNVEKFNQEYRIISPSGEVFWIDDRTTVERDSSGKVIYFQGVIFDITNRKQAELDYQSLFEGTGTAMCVIDAKGILTLVNQKVAQILQTDISNIIGTTFLEWISDVDKKRMMDYHLARLRGEKGLPENYEFQFINKKGHTSWAMINLTFIKDTAQTLASMSDISEIKQTEHALEKAIVSQNAILAAVPDLMFEIDANGQYLNIWAHNPQELAKNKEQLLGQTISEILPTDTAVQVMEALKEASEKGTSFGKQIQIDTPKGREWFELSVSLKDSNITPNSFIVLSRNITERKQMEEKLIYLSNYDTLTNLYNRRMLEEKLIKDIQRTNRYNHPLSLFMIDIDHFKNVNDTYGHHAGDIVLAKVASVLKESIRETDYAVRYGGEEFVIVLPETSLDKAVELAERLRIKIADTNIELDDNSLSVTVSIGVSDFSGETLGNLINLADSAMYEAKESGRNCVKVSGR